MEQEFRINGAASSEFRIDGTASSDTAEPVHMLSRYYDLLVRIFRARFVLIIV